MKWFLDVKNARIAFQYLISIENGGSGGLGEDPPSRKLK